MADEPELYLQVVGFDGLHGVRKPGRVIDHITWRTELVESDQYKAIDPKLRLIVRELIDLQAQGGGKVEYRLKSMRRRWKCKAEKYLAKLIAGGIVRIVDRSGRGATPRGLLATYCGREATCRGPEATPLLEISKGYDPQNRNMNKRGRARAPEAPRTASEEGDAARRRNVILDTIRTAAANNNLPYAFLQCRRDDEIGNGATQAEFAELWIDVVRQEIEDEAIRSWQPNGAAT